jgi:hypothetical protein
LWQAVDMAKAEIIDLLWLPPREIERATHLIGTCSECCEIICVAKANSGKDIEKETRASLDATFHAHVNREHFEGVGAASNASH